MKLRILGDSLRLRLSQSEVKRFGETGDVTETTCFGAHTLRYSLRHEEGVEVLCACMEGATITVRIPVAMARTWVQTEQVSLKAEQALPGGGVLTLLVEKDFKCVVPRPGEEDYDGFEHPTGAC